MNNNNHKKSSVKMRLGYCSAQVLAFTALVNESSCWTVPGALSRSALTSHHHLHHPNRPTRLYNDVANDGDGNDNVSDTFTAPTMILTLPKDERIWKEEGERIIKSAALEKSGDLLKEEDIKIEWKSGKIVVTVANAILKTGAKGEEEEDVEITYDDKLVLEADDIGDDSESEDDLSNENAADVVSIARAINFAFSEEGEDSLAYSIVYHHEIEVTTPGATDALEGIMFESYKGFNVIVEFIDPKKKDKVKIMEGNLVKRTDEFTVINCKGKRRKFKNDSVINVKLPKAKREKGAR